MIDETTKKIVLTTCVRCKLVVTEKEGSVCSKCRLEFITEKANEFKMHKM